MPRVAVRALTPFDEPEPMPFAIRIRAFASVEVHGDFDAAREAWNEIERVAEASRYQSLSFARAWCETFGVKDGVTPLIVVARDENGAAVALLPLGSRKQGPLRVAGFLGGRCANYQMGLFAPGFDWAREDIEHLLRDAAMLARPRVDAFTFIHQPESWAGVRNPMIALPSRPSPSNAYASALPATFETWFDTHFSKSSQKKFRKKVKKLEAFGPLLLKRAGTEAEARAFLDAFHAQKRATSAARGQYNEFDEPENIALLERVGGLNGRRPVGELHALFAGERIVAVLGAFADRRRLSGMVLSYDNDPEIAASSPGEWMVIEIAKDCIGRGLREFDLGIGASRYKSECCEIEEPMFDSSFAVSLKGRIGAAMFVAARGLKARVKQSPRLLALATRVRERLR